MLQLCTFSHASHFFNFQFEFHTNDQRQHLHSQILKGRCENMRYFSQLITFLIIISTLSIEAIFANQENNFLGQWRQLQENDEGYPARCVIREDEIPSAGHMVLQYYFAIESSELVHQVTIDELEGFLFYILYAAIFWCPEDEDRQLLQEQSLRQGGCIPIHGYFVFDAFTNPNFI